MLVCLKRLAPFTNTDTFVSVFLPSFQVVKTFLHAVVFDIFFVSIPIQQLSISLSLLLPLPHLCEELNDLSLELSVITVILSYM